MTNRRHGKRPSLQDTAVRAGRSLAVDAGRAGRATARSGEQALRRLAPHVEAAAADVKAAAGRVADQAQRGYRQLPLPGKPAPSRARRLRPVLCGCAGLLGLVAVVAWRRRPGSSDGDEAWFPTALGGPDEPPHPDEAVAAVSARGVAAVQAVEESTLTSGTTGGTGTSGAAATE
ncbi:hypothetical protein OH807_02900 [Kitasatospora sp. NBC_01560]|uniref:hypothetical protein n=1 Tax=Kitasatospora sp. NBC_01560 TaxID=2975965 RepID=UPI003868F07A